MIFFEYQQFMKGNSLFSDDNRGCARVLTHLDYLFIR
jgi:hypothetical protein